MSNGRDRLVAVKRSRHSPDESANRERGEQAGLSEAKGMRRQPPATGERRACEWWQGRNGVSPLEWVGPREVGKEGKSFP